MKGIKKIAVLFVMTLVLVVTSTSFASAKKKGYKVKGTTLTITSSIPRKTKIKNAKKIKKIVVKKGVKKLYTEPFTKCKNVKTLEVPGDLTFQYKDSEYDICKNTFPIKVRSVKFTSALKSEKQVWYYHTKRFVVAKTDKKFLSIDGNIYDKSGKTLLAVPTECVNLNVADSCEKVNLSAFSYMTAERMHGEDWSDTDVSSFKELKTIFFPKSVKEFTIGKLGVYCGNADKYQYTIANHDLSRDSMVTFFTFVNYNKDVMLANFSDVLAYEDDFLIYHQDYLLGYYGCSEEVTIPATVEDAYSYALHTFDMDSSYRMIRKLNFPSTYKGDKKELWHDYYANEKEHHYNEMEINVDFNDKNIGNDDRVCYRYCKHSANQYVKMTASATGALVLFMKDENITFYDQDHKEISTIVNRLGSQECSYGQFIKTVEKGEIIYAKLPATAKENSNFVGDIDTPMIVPFNKTTLKLQNDNGLMQGIGDAQYLEFSISQKSSMYFKVLNYAKANGTTVTVEQKESSGWTAVTDVLSNEHKGYSVFYGILLEVGEYRLRINAPKDTLYEVYGYGKTEKKELQKPGKTKKTAAKIKKDSFVGGLSNKDGNTAWFTYTNKKNSKMEFWMMGQSSSSEKVTVMLYKKGTKKALKSKKVALDGTKDSFSYKLKKGTYYMKITRSSSKVPMSVEVGVTK